MGLEDMEPDECRNLAELLNVMDLGDEQEKLERLWHEDTVGCVWFGEDDAWMDKRLKR